MDSVFEASASATPPAAPASPSSGYPTNGSAVSGIPATTPGAYWFHMVTQELLSVINAAGISPNYTSLNQLSSAIAALSKEKGLSYSKFNAYNDSVTLPADVVGSIVEYYGGSTGKTLTLPPLNDVDNADVITLINYATVPVTIAGNGTERIHTGGLSYVSINLSPGDIVSVAAGSGWFITSRYIDSSDRVRWFLSGDALPSSNIGPIFHPAYNSMMTWRTIGSYTGYASVNLGMFAWFDSTTPPTGWLECDGSTLSATYAALIAYRGSNVLRDLRGEFIRGWDHGRGVDSGRAFGSWQADELKSHRHTANWTGTLAYSGGGGNANTAWSSSGANITTGINSTGGSESRPRNVALLPCIKY